MITQDLKNPKSQGLGGLLIVLGILLAIFLAVILSALARPLVGALASTLFVWLVGGCVALYITRRFVLKFRYSIDPMRRLRMCPWKPSPWPISRRGKCAFCSCSPMKRSAPAC